MAGPPRPTRMASRCRSISGSAPRQPRRRRTSARSRRVSAAARSRGLARVAPPERAAEADPEPAAAGLAPRAPDARPGAAIDVTRGAWLAATTAPTPGSGGAAAAGAVAAAGALGATGAFTGAEGGAGSAGNAGVCAWIGADGTWMGSDGPTPDAPVAVMASTTAAVAGAAPARRRLLLTRVSPQQARCPSVGANEVTRGLCPLLQGRNPRIREDRVDRLLGRELRAVDPRDLRRRERCPLLGVEVRPALADALVASLVVPREGHFHARREHHDVKGPRVYPARVDGQPLGNDD